MSRAFNLTTAAALVGMSFATSGWAQEMVPMLTLATAKKIADGCEAKAKAEGWKMVIAVVDNSGNLKYYSRMDGSFQVSVRIAQLKAQTSAGAPVSSRQWGEISEKVKGLELTPGTVAFGGGFPIMAGGKHLGGVGVSGASAEQDEMCAQAGLDAAKDVLK